MRYDKSAFNFVQSTHVICLAGRPRQNYSRVRLYCTVITKYLHWLNVIRSFVKFKYCLEIKFWASVFYLFIYSYKAFESHGNYYLFLLVACYKNMIIFMSFRSFDSTKNNKLEDF